MFDCIFWKLIRFQPQFDPLRRLGNGPAPVHLLRTQLRRSLEVLPRLQSDREWKREWESDRVRVGVSERERERESESESVRVRESESVRVRVIVRVRK
jgi:hypothetical protein